MKNIIKYTVSLAIAGSLLWYVFKDIDLGAMFEAFQKADYRWIIVSGLLTILAHWSRAYRWSLLMEPVVGRRPAAFDTTVAVLTGYFANLIIPRMGEVTRCGTLNRLEGVPVNISFGTVVAERVFDALALLFLIAATFLLEFDRLSTFFLDFFSSKVNVSGLQNNPWPLLVLVGVLLGMALLAWVLYGRYKEILQQKPLYQKITAFTGGLVEGVLSVRKLKNPGAFLFHTILIWTTYYFMSYVLFFSLPQTSGLSMLAGLTILIMGGIGMAAPVQGGIGPFHLLVGNALVLYGLTQQDGIVLATFMHAVQTIVTLLLGAISFLIVLFRSKRGATEDVAEPTALNVGR
ncbi:lysylphosphatidylglycerol synthase transmembrane domain-containing protein [Tellurirhabdus bombi]|uniref:lysylphosphatidylglycerol synthase transmembrane domain-containing protein n=1 Tax=Tellurirhabdus bombi TaxID=2907205 RepID=UPI001F3C079C|nr:lysylphosphatidylglycerol synthase transmembrane domain-containing protein [Tellurirhabdus bombi]